MDGSLLLSLALILAAAKMAGEACERLLKQPAVLGEIVVGVLLGVGGLRWIPTQDSVLGQFAELGAVLLLFEVGLECDLSELLAVGREALVVAAAGVALPFGLGFVAARAMGIPAMPALFLGAALTATSVGITARVFADLGMLAMREAKIVLGAAVADDVIGLVILAAVSGLATTHAFSWVGIGQATGIALAFLVGAVVVGIWATPFVLRLALAMRTRAALSTAALVSCFLLAYLSLQAGLAPMVGAFAAGLVLARAEHKVHFEAKIRSVADLVVPVFFVLMGARMNLGSLDGRVAWAVAVLFAVALVGKVAAGYFVSPRNADRLLVGIGMIPRGEVGLIFASIGLSRGILSPANYASIVGVVVATTFATPPLLKFALRRSRPGATAAEVAK